MSLTNSVMKAPLVILTPVFGRTLRMAARCSTVSRGCSDSVFPNTPGRGVDGSSVHLSVFRAAAA